MLCSQKYITLICMANVFCSICTTICVGSHHNIQCCSLCLVTQVHICLPLLKAVHNTQTDVTLLQKYSMLCVCFCSEHTRHRLCCPLEGQCFECFTSNRLSWDTNGLGLPLEMTIAVTFSPCEWIINS
jgi:hypothetical protein